MATYQAIAATGQAILGLLEDACPRPEFANARFELYQSGDFQNPMEEGVSLYLYRVTVNTARRNLPPKLGPDGRRYRPPIPIDLHYMLTPWARTAVKQQRLLGWAIRALEDMPILPSGLLNRAGPEPDIFHPDETVELLWDPIPLSDMTSLWEVFKPHIQASITYTARMLTVESTVPLVEGLPVQTRAFDMAKGPGA